MVNRWLPSLLALALLATACSKAPAPSKGQQTALEKASDANKVVSIRVGQYTNEPSLDAVIAAFQDKYPNYRAEQVPLGMPIDAFEGLKSGPVDVVSDASTLQMMISEGLITNLDPFIAKSRLDLAPYGAPLESVKVNGHLYGMPAWSEPLLFAYSKPFAQAANVTMPTTSWTWDEFRETAARLTKGTGPEKTYGFDPNSHHEDLAYMLALQKTAAGARADAKTYREVLQFLETMRSADGSMPPARKLAPGEYPAYCYTNRAAICLLTLSAFMRNKLFADFALAPFPAAPQNRPVAMAMTRSYTMLAKTTEPEAAWAFISFVSSLEGQTVLARQGYFPAYFTDATRQAWLESSPPPPAGAKSLLNAAFYPLPRSFEWETYEGIFFKGANDVLTGAASVDDAVAGYEKAVSKLK